MPVSYYHGTSHPLYHRIIESGHLEAPVHVATEISLARLFSAMRVRFHPDPQWVRRRLVLELDLSGYEVEPDPDPEANVPGSKYYGKLFRVMTQVPSTRIKRVVYYRFPEDLIQADLQRMQKFLTDIAISIKEAL